MKVIGIFYFVLGFLFVYLTFLHVETNGWGFLPILFAIMASFDFLLGWRSFQRKPPTSTK